MELQEYYMRHVPEYYDDMYKDGFTPMEIKYAHERMMYREIEARQEERAAAKEEQIPTNVNFHVEIKKK